MFTRSFDVKVKIKGSEGLYEQSQINKTFLNNRPPASETARDLCVRKTISGISHARRHFCYLTTKSSTKIDVASSISSLPFFYL